MHVFCEYHGFTLLRCSNKLGLIKVFVYGSKTVIFHPVYVGFYSLLMLRLVSIPFLLGQKYDDVDKYR